MEQDLNRSGEGSVADRTAPRILVTPRSLSNGHNVLRRLERAGYTAVTPAPGRRPTEEELISSIGDCVGYLAGLEPVTEAVLSAAPKLKAISRNGTGIDNIDIDAASRRNIAVLTADGANAQGVAELTLAFILCSIRNVTGHDMLLKQSRWERSLGREVSSLTLGVIGLGNIGMIVAKSAVKFGIDVVGYDPYRDESEIKSAGFLPVTFEDLLSCTDVITLHCPLPRDARPVFGRAEFGRCRHGTVLINTARAGLVDADAVIEAIDAGRISTYAVDVHSQEPPLDWTIAKHPRVIATPHIGGYTRESVERAAVLAVNQLLSVLGSEQSYFRRTDGTG